MSDLIHDATLSIGGYIYQFYHAVDCFLSLEKGEVLYIEKYGDISILGNSQFEVKNVSRNLTNNSAEFWKTLFNWMQNDFNDKEFKSFILLTTQCFSSICLFKGWNNLDLAKKMDIIQKIFNSNCNTKSKLYKWQSGIFDPSKIEKLKNILDKFLIIANEAQPKELWDNIKEKHGSFIPDECKNEVFDILLGYLLTPEKVYNSWKLTYDDKTSKINDIKKRYSRKANFPMLYKRDSVDDNEVESHSDKLYMKKIKDINNHNKLSQAYLDYTYSIKTINEHFTERISSVDSLKSYKSDLSKEFDRKHENAILGKHFYKNDESAAKAFYNNMMSLSTQDMPNYESVPNDFKNGILHILCDNQSENKKWKLE